MSAKAPPFQRYLNQGRSPHRSALKRVCPGILLFTLLKLECLFVFIYFIIYYLDFGLNIFACKRKCHAEWQNEINFLQYLITIIPKIAHNCKLRITQSIRYYANDVIIFSVNSRLCVVGGGDQDHISGG